MISRVEASGSCNFQANFLNDAPFRKDAKEDKSSNKI